MLHRHCRPIRLTLPNGIFIASRIQYPLHKGAAHHFRHHVVRRSVLHYQALYLSRGSARYGRACKKYSREAIQIDGMAVVVHHYLAISHSYHCLRNLDDSWCPRLFKHAVDARETKYGWWIVSVPALLSKDFSKISEWWRSLEFSQTSRLEWGGYAFSFRYCIRSSSEEFRFMDFWNRKPDYACNCNDGGHQIVWKGEKSLP